MKVELLLALLLVPAVGGIAATRLNARQKQRQSIARRLATFAPMLAEAKRPVALLKVRNWHAADLMERLRIQIPGPTLLNEILTESGLEHHFSSFLILIGVLFAAPILAAWILNLNLPLAALTASVLAAVPFAVLKVRLANMRKNFLEQLPNAIDLMVAVLRSGHSVSQSVKAVAQEIPGPCGEEFEQVLQRMNLGQALSEALVFSATRFRSYELDLLRRAVAIQAEVGGSLAELLGKTNATLRQRLKLARQITTITAQSRLSGIIVAILPFVLAVVLNILSPGYMQLLFQDEVGRLLLTAAIVLELVGILVMKKMSTLKV